MNLFSDHECAYCGYGEADPRNSVLFNGFVDQDTGDTVCWSCRELHYLSKARRMGTLEKDMITIKSMTYSEMPLMNRVLNETT